MRPSGHVSLDEEGLTKSYMQRVKDPGMWIGVGADVRDPDDRQWRWKMKRGDRPNAPDEPDLGATVGG